MISYQLIRPEKCDIHSLTSLDYISLCYLDIQDQYIHCMEMSELEDIKRKKW